MADASPAPAARGGATVVANTLHVLQAKVVTLTPAPVKEAAGRTRAAFRAKPWTTTALALSLSSFILNLIAFFVRWVTFSNGGSVRNWPVWPARVCESFLVRALLLFPSVLRSLAPQVTGYITLTEVSNCLTLPPNQYYPAYECGVYQLLNNVPLAAKWIYSAGAASLSFLIFAFVANALATWLTYLRRINSLHTLPAFMHRLHGENIMVRRCSVACARAFRQPPLSRAALSVAAFPPRPHHLSLLF